MDASIASLIGWWPVPGTFHRTVVETRAAVVRASRRRGREPAPRAPRDRGPALVAPAGDEHDLELGDDRAGDPAHHVVEPLVVVVVLDPAAADVGDADRR